MDKTKIDWCNSTWNPVTGCLHGCQYCYARGIAKRFGGWELAPGMERINVSDDKTHICIGKDYYGEVKETEWGVIADISDPFLNKRGRCAYPFGFTPTFHRYRLNDYINKKGRIIFVCSMADLFGKWVPDEWIIEVFEACKRAPQHTYLFLTKNPGRYVELINKGILPGTNNMWYGYSATQRKHVEWWNPMYNIFASVEPILEPMDAPRCKWCIIGAESGNRKNKVIPERKWIESIVNEYREHHVPIFMKSSLTEIWGEPLIQEFPWDVKDG